MISTVIYSGTDDRSRRGCRGVAQPGLQERSSARLATGEIGFVWTLWNAPLFYLFDVSAHDPSHFRAAYLPGNVFRSVVLASIYDCTGGSLLFPMEIHSPGNGSRLVDPVEETGNLVAFPKLALAAVLVSGSVVVDGPTYPQHLRRISSSPG